MDIAPAAQAPQLAPRAIKKRPLALDLFCGAGGVSMGLYRAGFDVVGIDIKPQPRYPFTFIQADSLTLPVRLSDFDFIWASPPCQAYSIASLLHRNRGKEYPDLIEPVRNLLKECGVSYCIENVSGAPLQNAFMLCGLMFDLKVFRHRFFESSFPVLTPLCNHRGKKIGEGFYSVAGGSGRWKSWGTVKRDVSKGTVAQWREAMGIDWMTRKELTQAIPPAYSEFIGKAALR